MFCLQALIRDEFEKTKVTLAESSRRKLEAAVAWRQAQLRAEAAAAAEGEAAAAGTDGRGHRHNLDLDEWSTFVDSVVTPPEQLGPAPQKCIARQCIEGLETALVSYGPCQFPTMYATWGVEPRTAGM